RLERDPRHNPLFQIMFAFQNVPPKVSRAHLPDLSISPVEVADDTAKFDLTLYVSETGKGLTATWRYNSELFDAARVRRMASNFETLLEGVTAHSDHRISDLPLLSDAERQLLAAWDHTAPAVDSERCFHQLFEEQVLLAPDAPAVMDGAEELTYRELNVRA